MSVSMKNPLMSRSLLIGVLLCAILQISFAQSETRDDFDAANQYVIWIKQAIAEDRLQEANAALSRAIAFSNINSDISYQWSFVLSQLGEDRLFIINFLDRAIEVDRWNFYSKNEALVLKAEQLIAMRRYSSALAALDLIIDGNVPRDPTISLLPLSNDAAVLRLKAFRGIAYNSAGASSTEAAAFRTLALSTMNRFSRDPRPAVIFLEYLHFIKNQNRRVRFEIDIMDQQVLDIVIRRLPILAEYDPELVWMAAPFMQNEADSKRYVAAYRAGGFLENAAGWIPNPKSIPLALNYGLINDFQAVEELFLREREYQHAFNELEVINDTYAMLRSEEGREMFTQSLLNYSGYIAFDNDCDGIIEGYTLYNKGVIVSIEFFSNQSIPSDVRIYFDSNNIPTQANIFISGINNYVKWERYPFVETVVLPDEIFRFRPADFSFAPVSFITLGGSRTLPGIIYPVLSNQYELSRRALVSFCAIIERRNSIEFENAMEQITLENGIPVQAAEMFDGKIVSITEFEGGIPVIQYIDLDLDGRMETVRAFHRPGHDYPWPDSDEKFDYRRLIASSESDWRGDGRYKTGEVYLQDGSVVYRWDMDGSGNMNYFETKQ